MESRGLSIRWSCAKLRILPLSALGDQDKEAAEPFIFRKNGKSIAILNFADDEFITSPDGLYRCNPLEPSGSYYQIKEARQDNDNVIVIVHAGNEFYELPSPRIKNYTGT